LGVGTLETLIKKKGEKRVIKKTERMWEPQKFFWETKTKSSAGNPCRGGKSLNVKVRANGGEI